MVYLLPRTACDNRKKCLALSNIHKKVQKQRFRARCKDRGHELCVCVTGVGHGICRHNGRGPPGWVHFTYVRPSHPQPTRSLSPKQTFHLFRPAQGLTT